MRRITGRAVLVGIFAILAAVAPVHAQGAVPATPTAPLNAAMPLVTATTPARATASAGTAPATGTPRATVTVPVAGLASPSPSATASPRPSATATALPATGMTRDVMRRALGLLPDTCNVTVSAPTDQCPVTMRAVAPAPPPGDDAYRIGDVIRVDVTLASTRTLVVNAVQVALDFPAADLELVTGADGLVPVPVTPDGTEVAPVVSVASGTFGRDATVLRNRLAIVGTGDAATGQVGLDIGAFLPPSGAATPATVAPGDGAIIGTIFLRVRRNPTGQVAHAVTLRDSAATGERRGIVSDASSAMAAGRNVLGPVANATVPVRETVANLALVPAAPAAGTARRLGDVVAVALVIDPTTAVRNARAIQAAVTFDPADLLLVEAPGAGPTPRQRSPPARPRESRRRTVAPSAPPPPSWRPSPSRGRPAPSPSTSPARPSPLAPGPARTSSPRSTPGASSRRRPRPGSSRPPAHPTLPSGPSVVTVHGGQLGTCNR